MLNISYFFFTDTSTTEIYTLSLHDALPILDVPIDTCDALAVISHCADHPGQGRPMVERTTSKIVAVIHWVAGVGSGVDSIRSEEHTSELQSHVNLVCRLLLEKKKNTYYHMV